MSLNEKVKVTKTKYVDLPKDSLAQDRLIGLWRQAQEKAINMLKYDIDIIKDVDEEVDRLTFQYYLELKRRLNGYR